MTDKKYVSVKSCCTPDGKISCELLSHIYYGAPVYSVHIYESADNYEYKETRRSYPTGNMHKANTTYKQYCNKYLRSKL